MVELEQVEDLVGRLTLDGRILHVSQSSREVLGSSPEALIGLEAWALLHPADAAGLPGGGDLPSNAVVGDQVTVRVRHRQGHWVWLEASIAVTRNPRRQASEIHFRARDVTGRRGADVQIDQESKLESLGRLSAGLAHEINTPIQFVGDNARFLASAYEDLLGMVESYRELVDSDEPLDRAEWIAHMQSAEERIEFDYLRTEIPSAVAQTLEGIGRVSTIVRAMKTFSHPGTTEQVPADLNEALGATVTVTRHQVSSVAELRLELGDLPPVRCHIADLNQVFLNLIVNAADAIAETGAPGVIGVRSEVHGDEVVVSISDTGTGISNEVRAKMFDPFFTTKDVGRGSGQGLPLARAVVHEGHQGTLSVETGIGVGSTFRVRLPVGGVRTPAHS